MICDNGAINICFCESTNLTIHIFVSIESCPLWNSIQCVMYIMSAMTLFKHAGVSQTKSELILNIRIPLYRGMRICSDVGIYNYTIDVCVSACVSGVSRKCSRRVLKAQHFGIPSHSSCI